jgi:hypothetical protein
LIGGGGGDVLISLIGPCCWVVWLHVHLFGNPEQHYKQ